jgi:queuine tRNA-ribosyltransferase
MQAKAVPILNLNEFEIVTLKTGVKSLRSLERGETFHPGIGPLIEANQLHVDQQRLVQRSEALWKSGKKFVIWDVGLGAAANVLAAIEALKETLTDIEIHSFDKTTAPAEFAILHAEELDYLSPYQETLLQLLHDREVRVSDRILWKFHLGDFGNLLSTQRFVAPNTILYDPYSAKGNPEMWTLDHFQQLYMQTDPTVPCLLTNYTCSTAVRVALILAGFSVGRGCAVHTKRETTIASNQLALLEDPLDGKWLERVKNSTNAAPLRGPCLRAAYSTTRISDLDFEMLRKSPQFQLK